MGDAVRVSHHSGNNEWYTPTEYVEAARRAMGSIDCDPASSAVANSVVKATQFFTAETDGLSKVWSGKVWMNPPYAQPLMAQFAAHLVYRFEDGTVDQACVLVNNATETEWFQGLLRRASAICFPRQRIRFLDASGRAPGSPLQGQGVLYLGLSPERFCAEFRTFGFTSEVCRA